MAGKANITRRAAFTGALLSAAALAVPVAAAVRPTNLEDLARKLKEDAMSVDPTIKGMSVMYDETRQGPRSERITAIYIIRDPVEPPPDDLTAKWWNEFSQMNREQKLQYAGILRDIDPRLHRLADYIERTYA